MKKITAYLFASRFCVKGMILEFSELVPLPECGFIFLGMKWTRRRS